MADLPNVGGLYDRYDDVRARIRRLFPTIVVPGADYSDEEGLSRKGLTQLLQELTSLILGLDGQ